MRSYARFYKAITDIERWMHTTIYSYQTTRLVLSSKLTEHRYIEQDVYDAFQDAGYNAFGLIHRLANDNIKTCKELALTRCISALEVYLIEAVREVFSQNKSPFLKDGTFEYHLGELLSCSDISELHEKYIEKQCRNLHSGGFEDIKKFYKSRFNIDFNHFNTSINSNSYGLPYIQQHHQMRHLIIHRLGSTDEQYRRKYNTSDTTIKLSKEDLSLFFKVLQSFAYYVNSRMDLFLTTSPPENKVEIRIETLLSETMPIFDPSFQIPVRKNAFLPLSSLLERKTYESDSIFTITLHGSFILIRKYYKMLQSEMSAGKILIHSYDVISQTARPRKTKQHPWSDVEKVIELLPEKPWDKNIHKTIASQLGWSNSKVYSIIYDILNEYPNAIKMRPSRISLLVGTSFTPSVTIQEALRDKADWKSSNENVAVVEDGVITAITPGFAQISVKISGTTHYASCLVTVCEKND